MGSGGSSIADFARSVPLLREALEKAGRDPSRFPISKRVFLSVHERADVARAEVHRWYSEVYHNPDGTDASGIHGTPEPSKIGKTSSHGCVRLTNWDAQELAKLVKRGVTVEFHE